MCLLVYLCPNVLSTKILEIVNPSASNEKMIKAYIVNVLHCNTCSRYSNIEYDI